MKKFFEEFKTFAMRGNVIDMAVGVVIGGAFGKITTSIVNDIIMPLISIILDFIIIAFAVFCLVKGLNSLRRKEEPAPAPEPEPAPPAPTAEELLTEIRDLLKDQK